MSDGWGGEWTSRISAGRCGGVYASASTTPVSAVHAMASARHHCDDFRICRWGGGGFSGIELVMPRKNRGILSVIQRTVCRLGEMEVISQIDTAEYPTPLDSDGA